MILFGRETTEQLAQRYERWNRGQLYRRGPTFWKRFRARRLLRRLAGPRYAQVMQVLREQAEARKPRPVAAWTGPRHEQQERDAA